MSRSLSVCASIFGLVCAWVLGASRAAAAGDAAARSLLAPGAKLEKVAGNLEFSEGPAWHPDGYLLFEDIPRNRIMKLDGNDKVSVFREPSGRANGLAFDAAKRLVAAEGATAGGGRRVSRWQAPPARPATGKKDHRAITLADKYAGKLLNSPNDLVIDAKGRVYFTDPRYGPRDDLEQDKEAVYRIDTDGRVARIIDSTLRPNGIALSTDQKTLFVADHPSEPSQKRLLLAFDLAPDGSVSRRRVLHDFGGGRGIDGMTLDGDGRIWATAGTGAQAGVYVFDPNPARATAKLLSVIPTPEDPTNCTFGGPKRDWLYVTTTRSLFRIRTAVNGQASPPGK